MAHIYKDQRGRYRIQYFDATGKRRDVKGFTNLKATQIEAARLEDEAIKGKRGLIDPRANKWAAAEFKSIDKHLDDWRDYLVAKGSGSGYADLSRFRVARVFDLCNGGQGYTRISQLDAAEVQGVIKQLMDEGLAQQTSNHVVQSCKQFSRWLWRHDRAREHRLGLLHKYAVTVEKHTRAEISLADFTKMVHHVEAEKPKQGGRFNVKSADRGMMYRVAFATGFRRRAIASLTPESFDLTEGAATVSVLPGYSKSKKAITIPLSNALAEKLRVYLQGKPAGKPLWKLPRKTARMIRSDFANAGITFPDDKLFRDFHALRHSAISSWIDAGGDIKTVQEMAGHSTITLTARYVHTNRDKKRQVVNDMPAIPDTPNKENEG